ncbi:hypothetical protein [Tessaracoccus caeni]|uniref:hypothetical protein n=1 Tax=Tessaracoccus caeni TaxID=3031239 RepID=UPI0023DB901F|nr:hypothetical protein [Tessaracoccus caeni]MDF1488342.1 hypothetical protein [Tessaracoccus caeni]
MKPRIDAIAVVVALTAIGFGITACYATVYTVEAMHMQWILALILIFSGGAGLLALRAPRNKSKNNRKEIRS